MSKLSVVLIVLAVLIGNVISFKAGQRYQNQKNVDDINSYFDKKSFEFIYSTSVNDHFNVPSSHWSYKDPVIWVSDTLGYVILDGDTIKMIGNKPIIHSVKLDMSDKDSLYARYNKIENVKIEAKGDNSPAYYSPGGNVTINY